MVKLPAGYKPLFSAYASNSNNWIVDTGVKTSNTLNFDVKMRASTNGRSYLFGARNTNSNTSAGQTWIAVNNGTSTQVGYASAQTTYTTEAHFFVKDGTDLSLVGSQNAKQVDLASTTFTGTRNIYIFGRNNAGTAQSGDSAAYQEFYRMRIWDGDDLIRDYVPAVEEYSTSTGLYDVVNSTFDRTMELTPYLVTMASSGGGQGKINSEIFGLIDSIYIGEREASLFAEPIRLKAVPDIGYAFSHWTDGDGNILSTEAEFNYKDWYFDRKNYTLTAHFVKMSQDQPNRFTIQAFPYGKGYEDYINGQEGSDRSDIFANVYNATIKEDIMQKCSSTIELTDNHDVKNGTAIFLKDPRGKTVFCGIVKSNDNGVLNVAEPLAILDADFLLDNGTDVTEFRLDWYVSELMRKYLDGIISYTNQYSTTEIRKKCFPFESTYDQDLLADTKMNYIASPPAVTETNIINLEDFIYNLANGFIVIVRPKKVKKEVYVLDVGNIYYDAMQLKVVNPFTMNTLKIGSNSEEISNLNVSKEETNETYNALIVFDSTGSTLRGSYQSDIEPEKTKIVMSDDSLKTLREQFISSGTYNHKITFDVDLSKGTLRLEDFELGRPVEFYDGDRLYQTFVTAREYEVNMNYDSIKSVKVTLGKTRTNLTSKLNLRK